MSGIEKNVAIQEVHELASRGKHPRIPRSTNSAIGLSDQLDSIAESLKPGSGVVCGAIVNNHKLKSPSTFVRGNFELGN